MNPGPAALKPMFRSLDLAVPSPRFQERERSTHGLSTAPCSDLSCMVTVQSEESPDKCLIHGPFVISICPTPFWDNLPFGLTNLRPNRVERCLAHFSMVTSHCHGV